MNKCYYTLGHLQQDNKEHYEKGAMLLRCTICESETLSDEIYSNKGENAVCLVCANRIKGVFGLTTEGLLDLIQRIKEGGLI